MEKAYKNLALMASSLKDKTLKLPRFCGPLPFLLMMGMSFGSYKASHGSRSEGN
jgi:hypothetical protein